MSYFDVDANPGRYLNADAHRIAELTVQRDALLVAVESVLAAGQSTLDARLVALRAVAVSVRASINSEARAAFVAGKP